MKLYSVTLLALLLQTPPATPGAAPDIRATEARYRAAIALHPDAAAYHYSLATVLERTQRHDEALRAYRRAVELDSLTARHRAGYGLLLLQSGDAQAAEPQLRAAVALDAANVAYRLRYAHVLSALQKWSEAAAQLRQARTLDPVDARIPAWLSEAEQRAGASFEGYHDFSDFTDEESSHVLARVVEYVIAAVLVLAAAVLFAPVLGALFLLLIQAPLAWARAGARR